MSLLFYDKRCDIYKIEQVMKIWTQIKEEILYYENVVCDYWIATRGNVVNRQPDLWEREQELLRIDLSIPWGEIDPSKPIDDGMFVKIWDKWFIIDQHEYEYMPDGSLDNLYLRLNQRWL